MAFEIEIVAEAEADLDEILPFYRSRILDAVEQYLRYAPTQISRARIKQLRLVESPAFRLRVDDYRVFYDVDMELRIVTVLRVLSKEQSLLYLAEVEGGEL